MVRVFSIGPRCTLATAATIASPSGCAGSSAWVAECPNHRHAPRPMATSAAVIQIKFLRDIFFVHFMHGFLCHSLCRHRQTHTEFLLGAPNAGRPVFRRIYRSTAQGIGIKPLAAAGTTDSRRNLSAELQRL